MDMENMRENMRRGVIPGVMAGYVFLAYAGPGMQDAIGGMIGSNAFIGFILHLIISIIAGASTPAFLCSMPRGPIRWWILWPAA